MPPKASKPQLDDSEQTALKSKIPIERRDKTDFYMNYDETQNNEIEALRSIYGEDFTQVETKAAWSTALDKSFKLRLVAKNDKTVAVTVLVKFTATYPKTAPILSLIDHGGLDVDLTETLKTKLRKMPEQFLGGEMIFDIATEIEEELDSAAISRIKSNNHPSLEVERTSREALAARMAQEKDQENARVQEQEARERDEALKRDIEREQLRRLEAHDQNTVISTTLSSIKNVDSAESVSFDRLVHAEGLSFNVVEAQALLGRGPVTGNYLAIPSQYKQTSAIFCLKRASINSSVNRKTISGIEEDLEKLRDIKHPNVLRVFDFKLSLSFDQWKLDILCENYGQNSLTRILELAGSICISKARAYALEILHALEFVHKQGLIHGMLHTSNICFMYSSSGEQVLKLADVAFQTQLHNVTCDEPHAIHDQDNATGRTQQSEYQRGKDAERKPPVRWQPPERSKSRKSDIWSFGIILLQMMLGLEVIHHHASPQSLIAKNKFSRSFSELLRRIFVTRPQKRPNAFELLPYEFLRTDASAMDERPASKTTSIYRMSSHDFSLADNNALDYNNRNSRYHSEWAESGRVGKGAYGEVLRARNRNDGRIYAIKKIQSKTASTLNQVLPEVHLLATLNHPYVVRYFGAWSEEEPIRIGEDDILVSHDQSMAAIHSTEDFLSSAGALDFISSTNRDEVIFSGEGDEESEGKDGSYDSDIGDTNSSDTSGSTSARFSDRSSEVNVVPTRATRWTLYIQMEFCERSNLRDLLHKEVCQSNNDERWRLFRQILEGLVHIHSHGIIHRDLKPENIFIDLANNPKIGDFGLATAGTLQLLNKTNLEQTFQLENLTQSIGTAIYAAPELSSGIYNAKADMYALGLIFFEMCITFKTNMERVQTLFSLRERAHQLPAFFGEKPKESQIIESLIQHAPDERPSSSKLLSSGILPEQINDEHIRVALSGLSDSSSPYFRRMMTALFSQSSSQLVQDRMWEPDATRNIDRKLSTLYSLNEAFVRHRVESVFRRHGAIQMERQKLIPKSDIYGVSSKVAQFLDSSGTIVQLPFDLTLPWARRVAKSTTMIPEKTFTFGQVFRSNPYQGYPSSSNEVDFDVLSSSAEHSLHLKDAEVLKVMDEIIDEIPSLRAASICFHISHDRLIDLILEFCRIPSNHHDAVKEVVGKLDIQQWTWDKLRAELRAPDIGVSASALDDLAKFAFRDTTEHCAKRIHALFKGSELSHHLHSCFSDLREIAGYLEKLDIKRKFYVSPLGSLNHKFYRGNIMFQCLYDGKRRDVLAAGGRYDALLEELRPSYEVHKVGTKALVHAVSISIAWEKLVISQLKLEKQPSASRMFLKHGVSKEDVSWEKQAPRRCEVLVASLNHLKLEDFSLRILVDLWNARISAELATEITTPEELIGHYKEESYHFIVLVKHEADTSGKPEIKVKSMSKKEDFDVRYTDLAAFIRGEIRKESARDTTEDRHWHPSSQNRSNTYFTEVNDSRVHVLTVPQKQKKTNKWKITEDAKTAIRRQVQSLSKAPVACIEVHEDAFVALRRTRLGSAESWRKFIQDAPPKDRPYFQDVKELLETLQSEYDEATSCFIYNFRSGNCINYDFER